MSRGFTLSGVLQKMKGECANNHLFIAFWGFPLASQIKHGVLPMGVHQKPRDDLEGLSTKLTSSVEAGVKTNSGR